MKKFIKPFLCITVVLILTLSVFSSVSALSGSTGLYFSNNSPKVGENVTVTVSFKSDGAVLQAASGILNFDPACLEFVSGDNMHLNSPGTLGIVIAANANVVSQSATFKAIGEGNAWISLTDCKIASDTEISINGQSAAMNIKGGSTPAPQPPASPEASSNADLTSLTVSAGTLTPAFNRNITEYTVTVPNNKTDGIMYCQVAHAKAKIAINGARELAVGITKRSVTVTAENGNKKVYTITFNRLDENGKDVSGGAGTDKTEVTVGKNADKYLLTEDFSGITVPMGLVAKTYTYGEKEFSGYTDASQKLTVVCLENPDTAEKKLYLLNDDNSFSEFAYVDTDMKTYILLDTDPAFITPDGMYATDKEINGVMAKCYKYTAEDMASYCVVRAMAPDGNTGYFRYDADYGTLQRCPEFVSGTLPTQSSTVTVSTSRIILIALLLFAAAEIIIAIVVIAIITLARSKRNNYAAEDYNIELEVTDTEETNE